MSDELTDALGDITVATRAFLASHLTADRVTVCGCYYETDVGYGHKIVTRVEFRDGSVFARGMRSRAGNSAREATSACEAFADSMDPYSAVLCDGVGVKVTREEVEAA